MICSDHELEESSSRPTDGPSTIIDKQPVPQDGAADSAANGAAVGTANGAAIGAANGAADGAAGT